MPRQSRSFLSSLAILMLGTVASHAGLSELNGVCMAGNCTSPDQITYGTNSGLTTFSFGYVAGSGDAYTISGTVYAAYGPSGTLFSANVSALYTGAGQSVGNDSFTVDILQNFFDDSPGSWDGLYTESVPLTIGGGVGAGSSVSVNLFWNGQGVGVVGPFVGPGTYYGYTTNTLTGLTQSTLTGDFRFSYSFLAGASTGSGVAVSSTPEPSAVVPGACLLLAGAVFLRQIRRPCHGTQEHE